MKIENTKIKINILKNKSIETKIKNKSIEIKIILEKKVYFLLPFPSF